MRLGAALFALGRPRLVQPWKVDDLDAVVRLRPDVGVEVVDGVALIGAGAVRRALRLDLDLAHGVAHRAVDLVAGVGFHFFESRFRKRSKRARLLGEVLVYALRGERRAQVTRVNQQPAWPALLAATGG